METENRLVVTENACYGFKFNWTIPNFKNIPGGKLNHSLPTYDKCQLQLELVLKVTSGTTRKLIIGLSKKHYEPHDFYIFFYYEFYNFQGEIFCKDSLEFLFSREEEKFSREVTKPTSAVAESNIGRHFYYVSIRGHVVVKPWIETVGIRTDSKDEAIAQLQQDFRDSLQSGEGADITLDAGNEQFRVHKFVLCSRSPVFRRMFTNDMSENRQNRITIDDIDCAVLKNFLTYLYTGEMGRTTFDSTGELYSVGDKYGVGTLQESCRDVLICYLSEDTVSLILKLADMHSDRELEEKAVNFISKNFKTVAENAKWKTLISDSPYLASRTLEKVCNNLSIKKDVFQDP